MPIKFNPGASFGLLKVDNLKLDGNTLSSTNTNGNILISPNGTGGVGIGGTPNANSILDIQSTTKPFMPPRMTTTQRDNVASPTAGMVIYNSTTNKLNIYTTTWEEVTSA